MSEQQQFVVPSPEPKRGFGWKAWQVFKVVQARLRFVAILVAVGVALAWWDTLSNYYEKWARQFSVARSP